MPAPRGSKSPARDSEGSPSDEKPLAMRRTPRRTAPPARLGDGDNWGMSPASKWVAKVEEKKTAPKPAEPHSPKVEPLCKTPKKRAETQRSTLIELRAKAPKIFNAMEGAVLTLLGEVIATRFIKAETLQPTRLAFFFFWGALVPCLVAPWLQFLATFQISKSSFHLDCMAKAVLNQLTMTPALTTVFLVLAAVALEGIDLSSLANMSKVKAVVTKGFGERYVRTAGFWMSSDFTNLLLMPVHLQPRFASVMAFAWSILSSLLTA
mmetsp:Transcript_500/g.790  ORF Transcript_500/g.790 Transcript_500/m.790 type:complete len:265 (+) Transcript_500:185-979(+)